MVTIETLQDQLDALEARLSNTAGMTAAFDGALARMGETMVLTNREVAALSGSFKGLYVQGEDIVQSDPNTQHVGAALGHTARHGGHQRRHALRQRLDIEPAPVRVVLVPAQGGRQAVRRHTLRQQRAQGGCGCQRHLPYFTPGSSRVHPPGGASRVPVHRRYTESHDFPLVDDRRRWPPGEDGRGVPRPVGL